MTFRVSLIFLATLVCGNLFGQKKPISHDDYFVWNQISGYSISHDGNIVTYQVSKLRSDDFVVIYNREKNTKDTIHRATSPKINSEGNFVVFRIKPEFDTIRKLKIDKVKKSKFPKDSLGIFLVDQDSLIKVPKLKSYYLPEEGEWLAYMLDHNKKIKEATGKKKKKKKKKKKDEPKVESKGKRIVFFNPIENLKKEFNDVKSIYDGKNDSKFAYVIQQKVDTLDSNFVYLFDTKTLGSTKIFSGVKANSLKFSHELDQLAFFGTQDTSEVKVYDLYHYNGNETKMLVDTNHASLPEDYSVSDNSYITYSKDGSKLYFGIWEIKREDPKDTIPKNEKFKVDIWHYQDSRVQPNQLLSAKKDEKQYYRCVYHLESGKLIQLEKEELKNGYTFDKGNSKYYLASDRSKYESTYSWDYPWRRDIYLIDTETGEKNLAAEKAGFEYSTSPSGNYLVYWDYDKYKMVIYDASTKKTTEINTESIKVRDPGNGTPARDGTYGNAGWTKNEDFIFYSEKDIWIYRTKEDKVNRVTRFREFDFFGPDEELRLIKLDRDSSFIDFNRCLVRAFNKKNKNTSFYEIKGNLEYHKLLESAHSYTNPKKAKKADVMLFRKSSQKECRDLYLTTDFKNIERITDVNPQQKDYNWANVELVSWTTPKGDTLQGLLYTPEDLDKSKKYPMMVYFYEEYSDRLHTYYRPKPTASIIYPTEYASNGYIVFIPDIKYYEGHPAQSAYDCIVSGTDSMIARYPFIDTTKLGLQGQSWGGYQTAQLITMTNKYAAAMAGAPVSNMFSAYGGIRWGSGLSREFQYEKTQSRIGATIWEKPELYIENSPIFHLPNVETPLLIMHNDDDGAVPWYQGIEMFMGMRRLGKPVWMLNYNGDEHNLMKTANRIDLSIRMKQFFDHFLMGKPAPIWLEKGIPAYKKGKITGYDVEE